MLSLGMKVPHSVYLKVWPCRKNFFFLRWLQIATQQLIFIFFQNLLYFKVCLLIMNEDRWTTCTHSPWLVGRGSGGEAKLLGYNRPVLFSIFGMLWPGPRLVLPKTYWLEKLVGGEGAVKPSSNTLKPPSHYGKGWRPGSFCEIVTGTKGLSPLKPVPRVRCKLN